MAVGEVRVFKTSFSGEGELSDTGASVIQAEALTEENL
jgi:hypothetical protein